MYLQFAGQVSNMQVVALVFTYTKNSECYDGMHSESVMCNIDIFPGIVLYKKYRLKRLMFFLIVQTFSGLSLYVVKLN